MTHYDVLVLGPQGPGRVELEERLRRLGHTVAAADIEQGTDLPAADLYDAVVLDAREPDLDWRRLRDLSGPGWPPLLLVADQPRRLISALSGNDSGLVVLTGSETDGGFQVALSVCAAIGRPRRLAAAGPILA
jgi:hypothetical protein